MQQLFKRNQIIHAIEKLCEREEGITFQRLARRLLREQFSYTIPHNEHKDLGADASLNIYGSIVVLCASLSANLSKIKSDVEKNIKNNTNFNKIIFCTPQKVSNEKIKKWEIEISNLYDKSIEILERSWVIDECLRPQNSFIVYEELNIAPSTEYDSFIYKTPLLGGHQFVTQDHQDILNTNSYSLNEDVNYLVWHTPPNGDNLEAVNLAKSSKNGLETIHVSEGADGDCILLDEKVYVSWVLKNQETELWSIMTNIYDSDLNKLQEICVNKNLPKLINNPYIARCKREIFIIFAHQPSPGEYVLRTILINSDRKPLITVLKRRPYNIQIEYSNNKAVCVVDFNTSLEVFSMEDDEWVSIATIGPELFKDNYVYRFDIAINDYKCIFVVDLDFTWSLFTIVLDLQTGEVGELWPISSSGKFPSIAVRNDVWLMSWVGAMALPIDMQGKYHSATGLELLNEAMLTVKLETLKLMRKHGASNYESGDIGYDASTKFIHKIDQQLNLSVTDYWKYDTDWLIRDMHSYVIDNPWAPVWIGVLNEEGSCVKSIGPIGYGNKSNWSTKISLSSNSGMISWVSGDNPEDCRLIMREFTLI